ncbi:prephenate dehydrogenase [Granulosicoccus sp. 3-233]|uniref:prephenate dehydrogenase n=1 Tax=Granulosicoccus sp. 3-233 TaxID=3417969 RepID=UPI003D3455ED
MGTLCIVGLGMIGGSLAAALKQSGHAGEITALVRSEATGRRGQELGFIDGFSTDAADVVPDADIIMLAVPMLSMRAQLESIRPHLKATAVITDAGSVKAPFIDDARAVFGSLSRVVPGHPIAGREKTGVDAADGSLYQGRRVLLTPLAETDESATALVRQLWEQTGAEVESLDPQQHDRVLAATSHLPHVLAFALVDMLARQQESEEIFRYSAGGFKDFTRIASSDPIMWRDVCLTNRDALLQAMDNLDSHLQQLRQAIDGRDGDTLEATFSRARNARDEHI